MKRFTLLGVLFVITAMMPSAVHAEQITSFDSSLTITRGDDALVRERIEYDFGGAQRHGIFRDLPDSLCPGSTCISMGIEFFPAARDGRPEPSTTGKVGRAIRQKIGDPEITITDSHTYELSYTLRRLVVEKDGKQIVSWNVTGDQWSAPILASTFRLEGPIHPAWAECFTGTRGSTERHCTVHVSGTVVTATAEPLAGGEGWTVDVWYPAGTFPVSVVPAPEPPVPYWLMFSGLMTLGWALAWWFFGRDAKGRGTIVPEYNPPKELKPYEAQALLHETASARGLTATVLDFARRGLLTIRSKKGYFKTFYTLVKVRDPKTNELDPIEQKAFACFFPEEENEFAVGTRSSRTAAAFARWSNEVNSHMREKGWHHWDPANARFLAIFMVLVMGFVGVYIVSRLTMDEASPYFALLGILGSLPFAYSMPRTTREGTLVLEHLKGFKRYIQVAEKDRLAFHEGPQATPERFSLLLPFAVALHEEAAWAKIFADIGMSDRQLSAYGVGMTTGMMSELSRGLTSGIGASTVSPSSGSGGGGSSGGGGGGGGGGSW